MKTKFMIALVLICFMQTVLFAQADRVQDSRVAAIYLDEYRTDLKYIPTLKEVDEAVRRKAEETGDEILEISYWLQPSSMSDSIAWFANVIGHELETDYVYSYKITAEVFMNELFVSSFIKDNIANRIVFKNLEGYYQYLRDEKQLNAMIMRWEEAYGPYFMWDIYRKQEFYQKAGTYPYRRDASIFYIRSDYPSWNVPDEDKETVQQMLDTYREMYKNAVMEEYGLTEAQMNCFVEDVRCIGQSCAIEMKYWMKAYFEGECYWIPFCEACELISVSDEIIGVGVTGLEKEMVSFIQFDE